MKKNSGSEKKIKGLSIRRYSYVMAAITFLVCILLLLVSYQAVSLYNSLKAEVEKTVEGQDNANDLQSASDYLTEQVRSFVGTGERRYLDKYFEEANLTRTRDKALSAFAVSFDGTEEYEALEHAVQQSMTLMETEYYAMRLAVEGFGYDISEYPEVIQSVVLEEADAALSNEDKIVRSRSLVFDDNYHEQKEIIQANTQDCLAKMVEGLHNRQADTTKKFEMVIRLYQILILLLVAQVVFFVVLISIQVIRPLIISVPNIQDNKPLPVTGSKEFRFLAETYNSIRDENVSQREELEYEACHDQLTDTFNRKGYEKIIETLPEYKVAFLLIDVDRFKGINDTYGHAEGDRVLLHLIQTVSQHFRSNDPICRIGGDEFVLILYGADRSKYETIESKITMINNQLKKGEGGVPPFSISVGVAFSDHEDADTIYKKADIALYKVKENTRCGCAVYDENN